MPRGGQNVLTPSKEILKGMTPLNGAFKNCLASPPPLPPLPPQELAVYLYWELPSEHKLSKKH